MRHVWNEQFGALYNRTYRVLYDAGINEKLADELAIRRVLAVALMPRDQRSVVSSGAASDDFTLGRVAELEAEARYL